MLMENRFYLYSNQSKSINFANICNSHVTDHGKENRVSNIGKHSAGNVTGVTLLDFIALPARARISLTFSGDMTGEGFLNLRKL